MCRLRSTPWILAVSSVLLAPVVLAGEEPAPPRIIDIAITNSQKRIRFGPYPGAQAFKILQAPSLNQPFAEDASGIFSGYNWLSPATGYGPAGFFRVQVNPISENELLTATILSRLAYGPTPDEIERVHAIGPQAFIAEQMAPETIQENLDMDAQPAPSGWQYFTATGLGSKSVLYIYLTKPGEGYIDDLKLVAGTVPEAGSNLLLDGDFEAPLNPANWLIATNFANSAVASGLARSGNSSLHIVATSPGATDITAIVRTNIAPALSSSGTYTLSYWYLPVKGNLSWTVRLSGRGILSPSTLARLENSGAEIPELQAWYVRHAIESKRQLLETLTQFCDNHFTTLYTKAEEYMDGLLTLDNAKFAATEFEYRELKKWREVLMNPKGTFYDLLKISAESPTMVIYLDTVTSSKGAANENYSREIMELFTMGVDNGYDQKDIEEMSRAWTGWRVDKMPVGQETNPFATPVTNKNNDPGYWTIRFNKNSHDAGAKTLFAGKTVEARFGPPYAGKSYQLNLPARTDTAGMKDGYDIISHLADLPYTQEFISVKLCRLFVHERFVHGIYDYTSPNLSPEAKLIKDCMAAWETPAADGRKGNLRNVLGVIFNSTLFRQQSASRQKVKTPFEFAVSAVRAIRAAKPGGGFTADSTGTDLLDNLDRLGMRLFNREEPDGWSEFGRDWINTSALVERMRSIQYFLRSGARSSDPVSDPVALLKMKLPTPVWRDAGAVADYFLNILFLGEGKANLDLDRTAAIAFLNTNDAGTLAAPFANLDPNSVAYDSRVRGMVALLMGLPRFQEQ